MMSARSPGDDLSFLEDLLPLAGLDVLDVGCGDGLLVRRLARLGARAIGLEVSTGHVDAARAQDASGSAEYVVGVGEALPLADASLDLVIFMKSLHHVPGKHMAGALGEARRVLRAGGAVYVLEPTITGSFFALMQLVDDEERIRTRAQAAIAASALVAERTVEYESLYAFADFSAFRRRLVQVDPQRAAVIDAREPELRAAFAGLATTDAASGERLFRQPMLGQMLRRPRVTTAGQALQRCRTPPRSSVRASALVAGGPVTSDPERLR